MDAETCTRVASPDSWPEGSKPALSQYLEREQLARELNVSMRTVERWAVQRKGPTYTRVGRKVYYDRADVIAWLKANRIKMVTEGSQ